MNLAICGWILFSYVRAIPKRTDDMWYFGLTKIESLVSFRYQCYVSSKIQKRAHAINHLWTKK